MTYTFTSKSWADASSAWTGGQDGNLFTSGQGIQVTTGTSGANATSKSSFSNVSKVVVTYNTNKNKGAGSIVIKIGNNNEVSNSVAYSGSSDGTSANFTTQFDFSPVQTGAITITTNTTTNSIWVKSITITYSDGGGDEPGGDSETAGSGTITFGSDDGYTTINAASVSGADSRGKTWTVTTAGTTSFTPQAGYAQIGSSNKPATSITFTTTLSEAMTISAFSAKFGGFSGTAGTVTLKVGETPVGTGSLNASTDVTVNASNTTTSGNTLTVTVTGISKGVKAYYISYTCTSGGPSKPTV